MDFSGEGFRIGREEGANTLHFHGRLRLNGKAEYQPMSELLLDTIQANPAVMAWDFRELVFINGSGLNVLYHMVLLIQKRHPSMNFRILGRDSVPWQQSALPNMKKLMPALRLEFPD